MDERVDEDRPGAQSRAWRRLPVGNPVSHARGGAARGRTRADLDNFRANRTTRRVRSVREEGRGVSSQYGRGGGGGGGGRCARVDSRGPGRRGSPAARAQAPAVAPSALRRVRWRRADVRAGLRCPSGTSGETAARPRRGAATGAGRAEARRPRGRLRLGARVSCGATSGSEGRHGLHGLWRAVGGTRSVLVDACEASAALLLPRPSAGLVGQE